jgi:hypothetical protein
MHVRFSMGAGVTYLGPPGAWTGGPYFGAQGQINIVNTNGVQFGIAGVKLEMGGMGTPFIADDICTNIAKCQRFALKISRNAGQRFGIVGFATDVTGSLYGVSFPTYMCKNPTMRTGGGFDVIGPGSSGVGVSVLAYGATSGSEAMIQATYPASFAAGQGTNLAANQNGTYMFFDAEI